MPQELFVANAGRKGKGVFARRDIPAGRVVIRFSGSADWIWNLPRADWEYALQVEYDRYVIPERGSPAWFLNHSCNPNCVLRGAKLVRTWRKVGSREELTIDYSTNVGWDEFEMVCACGSANCRRVIRSYGSLPPDLKQKYGRNVSPYLLEKRI